MSNTIYCTYLTVYSGNKLPPLYIGSTSIEKINNGYHGSVKSKKYKNIWKSELKENPHLFETRILTTHETREEALEEEMCYQIEHNVVNSDLYINMSIANKKFIFVDYDDPEYRNKMSEAGRKRYQNGFTHPFFGKTHSQETKHKMTLAGKQRVGSKNSSYGRKWFYNPETLENIKCLPEDKPENYIPGRKIWQPCE